MRLIELAVILEIAGDPNGKDASRFERTIADLKQAKIAGCSVVLVIHDHGRNVCVVPCFSHCAQGTLVCEDLMPGSVRRYFGVRVFTCHAPAEFALGHYSLNARAQVQLRGITARHTPGDRELTRIAEEVCHAG